MSTDIVPTLTTPFTLHLYQGSVKVAEINVVPGMTERELGNWVEKHIRRAESDFKEIT